MAKNRKPRVGKSSSKRGYVYVFANPNMKGLVKIGFTTRRPEDRILDQDYNTAGIPGKFEIMYYNFFENAHQTEQLVHKALSKYRYDKEFFKCDVNIAIKAIETVSTPISARYIYYHTKTSSTTDPKKSNTSNAAYDASKIYTSTKTSPSHSKSHSTRSVKTPTSQQAKPKNHTPSGHSPINSSTVNAGAKVGITSSPTYSPASNQVYTPKTLTKRRSKTASVRNRDFDNAIPFGIAYFFVFIILMSGLIKDLDTFAGYCLLSVLFAAISAGVTYFLIKFLLYTHLYLNDEYDQSESDMWHPAIVWVLILALVLFIYSVFR